MKLFLSFLFFLSSPCYILAQTISGKILNDSNEPLPFASVHLLNTNTTVLSDSAGRFFIRDINKGSYTAIAHATGYADRFFEIPIKDEQTLVPDIILSPDYKELGEVLVSADKREELAQDIPLPVSVISAGEVQSLQLRNSKEITAIVPNLYSANPGDNRNVTSVRGIVSSSYDPAVTTYIDGVSQFNLDTYIAELLDVERIEVLRGPQGTLYGRNSMGGVINIITKDPTNRYSGFAGTNLGNHGFQRFQGMLNVPVVKNKLMWRVAAVYNKLNGYYTNEFDNSHFDKQHSAMIMSSLKYNFNSHWSAELNAKQQLNRNKGAFALNYKEAALANPFKLDQNAVGEMVDNVLNSSLHLSYAGSPFNFNSVSSFQSNYRYYKEPIDADFSPLDAISIYNKYGRNWNYDRAWSQELKFTSPTKLNPKISWTAGAYLFYQKTPVRQSTVFGKDAKQAGIPDSLFSIENISTGTSNGQSLFGQVSVGITRRTQVIAGLRFDHENKKLSALSNYHKENISFAILQDTSAKSKFNVFSPKVGIIHKLSGSTHLYFNYSRGFRAGGLTQLSSDPSQPPLYPYKPEYSDNAEVGIKSNLHTLNLEFTLFYTNVHNAQIPVLILPDAITITKNAGSLRSVGLENEITVQVIKGLTINHSLGFTDAVFRKSEASQGGQQIELRGKHQVFTPNITSFLNLRYQHYLNERKNLKFEISGQWYYIGKQYFDIANAIEQAAYNLFNANAGIVVKKLSLSVWSKNIGNKRYIDYAYDFGAVHLGNPSTVGVAVDVAF
jgi:iron complex outermembrane receptor protein